MDGPCRCGQYEREWNKEFEKRKRFNEISFCSLFFCFHSGNIIFSSTRSFFVRHFFSIESWWNYIFLVLLLKSETRTPIRRSNENRTQKIASRVWGRRKKNSCVFSHIFLFLVQYFFASQMPRFIHSRPTHRLAEHANDSIIINSEEKTRRKIDKKKQKQNQRRSPIHFFCVSFEYLKVIKSD